jgi:DNA-binding NarL/FixJ family response regulator
MTRPVYEHAEALIYDPAASHRSATRAALQAFGFGKVDVAGHTEALLAALDSSAPDLVICDISGNEAELCDLIQSVRQGLRGKNPFALIMATTWKSDGGVVGLVLNSGADDLLVRPCSETQLTDRIRSLTERRKDFVVTADYIGPDRRRDATRKGPECITVPNALKIRTSAGLDSIAAEKNLAGAIKEARGVVDFEKMRRNAFQLCVQWRMLEQRRPGGHDFADVLERIEALNGDIQRRADGTPHAPACQWCVSLTESIAAIRKMVEAAKEQGDSSVVDLGPPLHLLGQSALALGQAFAPGEIQPNKLVELDALVARIEGRTAAQAPNSAPERAEPVRRAS